jgi:RimJ/RimL family protein N-acetyltransferase
VLIETDRLILREFQQIDFKELAPILADPKVMKFATTGVHSVEQVQRKIANFIACYEKYGFGKWAVILKESNRLIGYCGIAVEQIDGKDEKELGYRLDSSYWRQGLATEAASASVKYGFEHLNLLYVIGVVERANTASARVLGKVGMRYERTTIFHGVEMDLYQVNASEKTIKSKTSVASFKVRVLTAADAEAYREVRLQALHEHPPAFGSIPEDEPSLSETTARLVASDDRCFFGAFQDEQLIGIVRLSRYEALNEKHRAYLGGLYVLPPFRRNGCGKALVEQALSRSANIPGIRRINLTVVTQQEAALRLYQSLGFQIYGTEQETFSRAGHFYDEHLLTLNLVSDNVA